MLKKKTILLHIGFEKTGSTSIQQFCTSNSQELYNEGIFYLTDTDSPLFIRRHHAPLVTAFSEAKGFVPKEQHLSPEKATELVKEIANNTDCEIILFSAEPFSSVLNNKQGIEKLQEALSDFDVKIIAYIRRQDKLFMSYIAQYVKGGFTFPLSDRITMSGTPICYENKNRYDYQLILSRWEKVFGAENMIIRSFETTSLVDGDIIADFLNVLNVNIKASSDEECRENASLINEALLFLNLLNTTATKEYSRQYFGAIYPSLLTYPSKRKKQHLISNAQRQEIIDTYRVGNNNVAKLYMDGRSELFEEKLPDVNEKWKQIPPLSLAELTKIVNHLEKNVPNVSARIIAALCKL